MSSDFHLSSNIAYEKFPNLTLFKLEDSVYSGDKQSKLASHAIELSIPHDEHGSIIDWTKLTITKVNEGRDLFAQK